MALKLGSIAFIAIIFLIKGSEKERFYFDQMRLSSFGGCKLTKVQTPCLMIAISTDK